ncbi:MAG: NERD domain-containing protein [Acidimicrobiales bacterium]
MLSQARTKREQFRRRRELADHNRTARFARKKVWTQQITYAKRAWRFLVVNALFSTGLGLPALWVLPDPWGVVVVTASATTGVWLNLLLVLTHSGAVSALMGVSGEEGTAYALGGLARSGWRVVHGLMIREHADVDHVAVGPAGVVVIETKWSAHGWPIGKHSSEPFMVNRLAEAVQQARRNAKDVSNQFKKAISGAPVRPVLVVWSPVPRNEGDQTWIDDSGVTVVHGRSLRSWFEELDDIVLDEDHVTRIWEELWKQARMRDDLQEPPRPTLDQLITRSWFFLAGLCTPLGSIALSSRLAMPNWSWPGGLVVGLGVGLFIRGRAARSGALGCAALGLIASSTFILTMTVAFLAIEIFR